jgi:hypothetical protein
MDTSLCQSQQCQAYVICATAALVGHKQHMYSGASASQLCTNSSKQLVDGELASAFAGCQNSYNEFESCCCCNVERGVFGVLLQVWSWCLKFKPPQGVQDWNGTACLLHEFGK